MITSMKKMNDSSGKILMVAGICLILMSVIFFTLGLIILKQGIEPFYVIIMIFILLMGLIATILGYLIVNRHNIKVKNRIIANFLQNMKAGDLGDWYKMELIFGAIIISLFFLFMIIMIIIFNGRIIGILIYSIIAIITSGFLFYIGFRRNGWEFKIIEGFSCEEINNKILKTLENNNIKHKETKTNSAFFSSTWAKTYAVSDTNLSLSVFRSIYTFIGIGKINKQNKNEALKIKKLIDPLF